MRNNLSFIVFCHNYSIQVDVVEFSAIITPFKILRDRERWIVIFGAREDNFDRSQYIASQVVLYVRYIFSSGSWLYRRSLRTRAPNYICDCHYSIKLRNMPRNLLYTISDWEETQVGNGHMAIAKLGYKTLQIPDTVVNWLLKIILSFRKVKISGFQREVHCLTFRQPTKPARLPGLAVSVFN